MSCLYCLRRSAVPRKGGFIRTISVAAPQSTVSPRTVGPPAATSTGTAQPFSNPLSPRPNSISLGTSLRPKTKSNIPVSSAPAGTQLKGLNFIKGREDPLALPEEEYPEWLWRCLDVTKKTGEAGEDDLGDEFSKSKKQRRAAAKRQRKHEARLIASGDQEALRPKIPIQQQSINLPSNEEGTIEGALKAVESREEVRHAMRRERRAKIKEANFLKGVN